MRTIAALLTEEERQALAEYYGSGLGLEPASSTSATEVHGSSPNDKGLQARGRKPPYLSSSIAASSASLPGRVSDSGSVASGSSTIFSMSRKLGALVFT